MAWVFRASYINDGDGVQEMFGQLVFSGNYPGPAPANVFGGGDTGTFDFVTLITNGYSSYRKSRQVNSSKPPLRADMAIAGLYIAVVFPGKQATDFGIRIFDTVAAAELPAGPYPAAITGNPFHTLGLVYKRL